MASLNIRTIYAAYLPFIAMFLLLAGCASMQQPGGGPNDTEPPKILSQKPENLTKNFNDKKIEITFNEFIKLNNEYKEISISPTLNKLPQYKIRKNVLEISFADTLQKNTTYTINFGKGIVDYNEGNVLKNFSYVFSTGKVIDSLTLSGTVQLALNSKVEPDLLVFLIPTSQDSIFGKKPANIITQTDSAGNFIFRNLRPDIYNIYALKEQSGDRVYNSLNEEIGFATNPININKNINGVNLTLFKQEPPSFSVLDRRIEPDGRIAMVFNRELEFPSLDILNSPNLNSTKQYEFSTKGDSAYLWLPELSFDSIAISINNKQIPLDTVILRRQRRDTYNRIIGITDNAQNSGLSPQAGLILTLSAPITALDMTKVSLLDDTTSVKGFQITKDSTNNRKYKITYPWRANRTYSLRIADNAFTGVYGNNKYFSNRFKLLGDNLYGDLNLTIELPDSATYLVQLLKTGTNWINTKMITANSKVEYKGIPVGLYNIRIVYDENKNGRWDTGNLKDNRQPEHIWNSPKEISLRPNWDLEEPLTVPPR